MDTTAAAETSKTTRWRPADAVRRLRRPVWTDVDSTRCQHRVRGRGLYGDYVGDPGRRRSRDGLPLDRIWDITCAY